MERWLPPLSPADVGVLLFTLALVFMASRIRPLADAIERLRKKR